MRSLLMASSLCAVVMIFTGCSSVRTSGKILGQRGPLLGSRASGGSESSQPHRIRERRASRQAERTAANFGDGMPASYESLGGDYSGGEMACSTSCTSCNANRRMPLRRSMAAMAPAPSVYESAGDCGCSDCVSAPASSAYEGVGDCGCSACSLTGNGSCGLLGRRSNNSLLSNDRMGMRLSQAGSECSAGDTASGLGSGSCRNKIRPCGGQILGGQVGHAGGLRALGSGGGCGRFGCGIKGRPCHACKVGSRLAGHGAGGGLLGGLGGGHTKPYGGAIPHTAAPPQFNGGPGGGGAPQYVYPYYTTRGPRDFLMSKPPSIGN